MADALSRFVEAQSSCYGEVLAELRNGRKESHWIWFIFPQMRGLGVSATSWMFGIASREEAVSYLAHPVLGSRLAECTRVVNQLEGGSAEDIFRWDAVKFRSSMTLFDAVAPGSGLYDVALTKYFGGVRDAHTLELL